MIKEQCNKEKGEKVTSIFATYYESCVQYEKTVNLSERIKMGKLWRLNNLAYNKSMYFNAKQETMKLHIYLAITGY